MHRIILVDSHAARAQLTVRLLRDAIGGAHIRAVTNPDPALWGGPITVLILGSLVLDNMGLFSPSVSVRLSKTVFDGPGLLVVCSALLGDPAFQNGIAKLSKVQRVQRVARIDRINLGWAEVLLQEVVDYIK